MLLQQSVVGSLNGLLVIACICCTVTGAAVSQYPSRHRKLQQVTYITGFGNLPGFVPVQEELTPENPPLQVIYVPANQQRIVYPVPVAPPPPPSLADYIVAPSTPSASAPAPEMPPSPTNIPRPSPRTAPPPSPFAPAPADIPRIAPSPAPTPNPSLSPPPSPAPAASPAASPTAPVSAAGLFDLKGAVSGKPCQSVWQVLNQDPDLKAWVAVLQGNGLSGTFNSTTNQITVFAPVDAALSQNIFPGGSETNGARNLQQLLSNRPDAVNPIIGYNILPATYSLADMTAGRSLDTADTAKSGNSVQGVPERLQVNVTSNSGSTVQLQGIGNTMNILQGDIPACGPSVIHITDNALLPLVFARGTAGVPVAQQG